MLPHERRPKPTAKNMAAKFSIKCQQAEINTIEFLASSESLATVVLDDINYEDSSWDHSATQDMEVAEEEVVEVVVKEEFVEVTEASIKA
ncbi:hypothetical protein D1007_04709 [Hordeum vulgare]|nr:hypothetical protein D1007_04709 [Hordeum vulgare]